MELSGFTIIKNGITLGYPFLESILSISELCDEVIINVGFDDPECTIDDGTYALLVSKLNLPKFKFLKSWWDPEISKSGLILSQQTNIALDECKGDYCLYIQGDEVIHEEDHAKIKNDLELMKRDTRVEGLIFKYIHFYGNTNIIKHTRNVYRREVRLIKNHCSIKSFLDAQGFRKVNGEKVYCIQSSARIFHYGWARQEQIMNNKIKSFNKLYHGKHFESKQFNYERIWGLKNFNDSHPYIMNQWIKEHKNEIELTSLPIIFEWKNIGLAISDFIERLTTYRIGEYKNFKLKK